MTNRGRFITLEGGEGSGKSTLINKVKELLVLKNADFVVTREPGGTPIGEEIRNLVLHRKENISSLAELSLYLASRAQHVEEVIKPALNSNRVVICDRYNDSSFAYQGYARGLDVEMVRSFCHFVSQGIEPDLTLFLDIEPRLGFKRINQREMDRIESEQMGFHEKVREGYHLLAKKEPNRFYIIDATRSAEDIYMRAKELILCCLKI